MADQQLNIVLRAFDKTRAGFMGVRRGLDSVKKSVFSVKGAMTALAVGAGLKVTAKSIDELAKQSARLGVTVNQLQTLQFAASQSGTGAAELSKGFEKFNKSISEASGGIGTGVKAFEALGVTLTNNDGSLKDTDTLLNEVADGFTGIKDPADRVRIAMDLFGRSGAGMVNMLQDGSASLQDLRDEFNQVTITLTGEQAKAVEAANDRFDKLRRVFSSIGQQITVVVLPVLAKLATFFSEILLKAIAFSIDAFRDFMNVFIRGYNWLATNLPFLQEVNEATFGTDFAKKLRTIADNMEGVGDSAGTILEPVTVVAKGIERLESSLDKARAKFMDFSEASKEVKANLAGIAMKGLQSLEDGLVSIIDGTKSAKDAFKDMARSIISDLIRMQIRRSITGPLAGAMGLSGFFGGGKAIGGPVQAGGSYLVGERGPEILTMGGRAGHITPNNQISGGGGVVVNQTINVSTGVAQTVRTEIATLMPQIAEASKAAVLDAKQRGGNFSRAF